MNDDFEQQLRNVSLSRPSADLDRRMETLLAEPVARSPFAVMGRWVVWGLPAAGMAAALVLFSLQPEPVGHSRPMVRIVHHIEPRGLMRELLLAPPAHASPPPVLEVSVRL